MKSKSKQTWRCKTCGFDNFGLLLECQVCQQKLQSFHNKQLRRSIPTYNFPPKEQVENEITFKCPFCSFTYRQFRQSCQNCGKKILEKKNVDVQFSHENIKISDKEINLINCQYCKLQNSVDNYLCLNCEKPLRQNLMKQNGAGIKRATQKCRYCDQKVFISLLPNHQKDCQASLKLLQDFGLTYFKTCVFCYEKLKTEKYEAHQFDCKERAVFFQTNKSWERMTDLQRQTIKYMHQKSQKSHNQAEPNLTKRIKKLGYKIEDLENLHHYIINYAPIIIHMHVSKHMTFFAKDTHYRNQFQTAKSSGALSRTTRTAWQDRMFDGKLHNAKDFQRVKYGTINFTNDPKGVRACTGYGNSYFLLKEAVRDRCTFTDMDSSSAIASIGTFRFCYHVLNKFSDKQLSSALQGAKAKQIDSTNVIMSYKQIQIHGPVQFKKDIERVYVNEIESKDLTIKKMIDQFCHKNEVECEYFGIKGMDESEIFAASGIPQQAFKDDYQGQSQYQKGQWQWQGQEQFYEEQYQEQDVEKFDQV